VKIEFPRIVREVALSEYAPEIGTKIYVWVNPSVKLLADLGEAFKVYFESKGQEGLDAFLSLLSDILSQGETATHWTADELKQVMTSTADTDPSFWMWLQNRILQEIQDHRNGVKKV
jgi:archaellum biogenesis protein FlaJ (TadC family)